MIFRIIDETPSNAPLAPSISTFYPPAPSLAFTPYKVTVKSVRSLRIIFRIIGACPANDFSRPPPSLFPFFPPWLQMIDSMRALLHSLFPPPLPLLQDSLPPILLLLLLLFDLFLEFMGGGFCSHSLRLGRAEQNVGGFVSFSGRHDSGASLKILGNVPFFGY